MLRIEFQRILVNPGVCLVRWRLRYLAGVYLAMVSPIITWLNHGVSGS